MATANQNVREGKAALGYDYNEMRNYVIALVAYLKETNQSLENLILEDGTSVAEVIAARGDERTLGTRLNKIAVVLTEAALKGQITRSDFNRSSDSNLIDINDMNAATRATLLNFRTKNLFNKQTVTSGFYISSGNGNLTVNTNFSASDYIEVNPAEVITVSPDTQQGAWFNASKQYISGFGTYGNTTTLTPPANAKYLRISVRNSSLETLQIEKGPNATEYVPFGTVVNPGLSANSILREYLPDGVVDDSKVDQNVIPVKKPGKNIFNKSKVASGYYIPSGSGIPTALAGYNASDFMGVTPGNKITVSPNTQQGAYFDSDKKYVSGFGTYGNTATLTVPDGVAFLRISVRDANLNDLQIEVGETSTPYESYRLLIPANEIDLSPVVDLPYQRIQSVMKKVIETTSDQPVQIKLLGDSITQGVGGTGFAQDGEEILSLYNGTQVWRVNTSGHCWANSLKSHLEDKYNCTVKNYGMTGAVVSFIKEGLNQGKLVEDEDDIVILQVGTNNRNNNVSGDRVSYRNQLNEVVDMIRAKGKEVILMSSIPASVENEMSGMKFHMEDVDGEIMVVSENQNMEYVSNYKSFIDYCKDTGTTIDQFLDDGLHPNDEGYDVMFYLILKALGFGAKRDGATW